MCTLSLLLLLLLLLYFFTQIERSMIAAIGTAAAAVCDAWVSVQLAIQPNLDWIYMKAKTANVLNEMVRKRAERDLVRYRSYWTLHRTTPTLFLFFLFISWSTHTISQMIFVWFTHNYIAQPSTFGNVAFFRLLYFFFNTPIERGHRTNEMDFKRILLLFCFRWHSHNSNAIALIWYSSMSTVVVGMTLLVVSLCLCFFRLHSRNNFKFKVFGEFRFCEWWFWNLWMFVVFSKVKRFFFH